MSAPSRSLASRDGHHVIGVDIDRTKLEMIAMGKTPVIDEGMIELMAAVAGSGRVAVTTDPLDAMVRSEISLICVGTPSAANGSQDLSAILRLAGDLGTGDARQAGFARVRLPLDDYTRHAGRPRAPDHRARLRQKGRRAFSPRVSTGIFARGQLHS